MVTEAKPQKPQFIFVFAILLVAAVVAVMLFAFKPKAEKKPAPYQPPEVSWIEVKPRVVKIPVRSQGTVQAQSTINLSIEVAGRIIEISNKLHDGEFFSKGDVLAHIDDSDYKLAITKAEAQVAAAGQALARVEAEAEQARFDIKRMGQDVSKASAYARREPHLKEALANLKAAKADLAIAQLQHQRTLVKAPFDGRVIEKQIDVGEYVSPGRALARIYSSRTLEVKLPLTSRQLNLLSLPEQGNDAPPSRVTLSAHLAGEKMTWSAQLARVEGLIDARNQLLNVIAEIDSQPATQKTYRNKLLTAGLFVEAVIEGREIPTTFVVPRVALRSGNQLWCIKNDKLDIVSIDILHKDNDYVYIAAGLQTGDRVIVSALDYAIQGMQLKPGD